MTRCQKVEWLLSVLLIVFFILTMYAALQNFDLWGNSTTSPLEIFAIFALMAVAIAWVINYIIKIITSIKTGRDGRKIPLIWIFAPVFFTIATLVLINGTYGFSEGFDFLEVPAAFGIFITCIAYNIYFCVFFGKRTPMYVTLVLYNIAALGYAAAGNLIQFAHNVYLGFFIPAVIIGYLEFYIRERISSN